MAAGKFFKMAASSTVTETVTLTHSNLKRISPLPVIGIISILLSKLKEEATAKGIRMFPNPDLVDVDPTFSQVILRIFHCRIDLVNSFILLLNSNKDKFGYIEPLQSICIPSLKVDRNGDLTQAQRASISAFAKSYYEIRGKHVGGWIIKAPFSTSKYMIYCIS
jgi:hypothetical protein